VTSHPIVENHGQWWLCCGKWRLLHAVPGATITAAGMRDAIDACEPVAGRSACGLRRGWQMPGFVSRMGRRRCAACCQALGIAPGFGTPANEADRMANEEESNDA
jgi:hypothetical protein